MVDSTPDSLAVQEEEKVYEMFNIIKTAAFPGGNGNGEKFFDKHISYPFIEWLLGVEGDVFVTFVTQMDGSITDIKLEKLSKHRFNHQVMKAAKKLPRFSPPDMGGHPPECFFRYVVEFRQSGFKKARTICTLQLLATKHRYEENWKPFNR